MDLVDKSRKIGLHCSNGVDLTLCKQCNPELLSLYPFIGPQISKTLWVTAQGLYHSFCARIMGATAGMLSAMNPFSAARPSSYPGHLG